MHSADHFVPRWRRAGPGSVPLEGDAVHVWRIAVGAGAPLDTIAARRALLSTDERERADRFHFEADRDRFILCRGALRILLSAYIGTPPSEIVFAYGAHGRPSLADDGSEREARAPDFNLSHSGDLGLAAFARASRVGIDVERNRALPDGDRLAERFFSVAENAVYRSLSPAVRPCGFFSCWTRKEAFIKASGEGLSRPLNSFDVSLAPGESPRILRIDGHPGEERRWSLFSFEPAPGYMAALALEWTRVVPAFFDFGGGIEL